MIFNYCGKEVCADELDIQTALRLVNTLKMLYGRDVADKVFTKMFDFRNIL